MPLRHTAAGHVVVPPSLRMQIGPAHSQPGARLRSIRPRPEPDGGEESSPPSPPQTSSGRRASVRVACNRCRAKKVACDGKRPVCSRCWRRRADCEYISKTENETPGMALKSKLEQQSRDLAQFAGLVDCLRSSSDAEALAIIRRLKSTPNFAMVLSSIRHNMPPRGPSDIQTARGILPPTQSQVELELTVLHKKVYPSLEPLDISAIDLGFYPSVTSLPPSQWLTDFSQSGNGHATRLSTGPGAISPELLSHGTRSLGHTARDTRRSSVFGPCRPRKYCDSRLSDLTVDFWTVIPISNDLAASAISVYLETEHPLLGFFDADLFLADMVGHRIQHCSSFLVSALLGLACQCYTGFDSEASAFGLAFLRQAEKLWQVERSSNSVTTLAALVTLCAASTWQGEEQLAFSVLADARYMAEQMNLLGLPYTPKLVERCFQMTPGCLKATAHVAWGCYCWLSLHASYYRDDPVMYPPVLPIPGQDQEDQVGASTSSWPVQPLPTYMGGTFPAICKYWIIVQEVQSVYFNRNGAPLQEAIPLAFAEEKYQKLLAWADTLKAELNREETCPIHVSSFHALYHIAVLDIFRPFLYRPEIQRMRSFSSVDSSPAAIFTASMKQLQRLLVEYRIQHNPRLYSPIFSAAVLHINNIVVRDTQNPDWRFYFLLCMGFWKEASVRHPCMSNVAQANLSLGMRTGSIKSKEARGIMKEIQSRMRHHDMAEVAISCIVDFDKAICIEDDGNRAQPLVETFDELAILDELTTGDYEYTPEVKGWKPS